MLSFSRCTSELKKDNLQSWFYDLPVYENVNVMRAKLTLNKRFSQEKVANLDKAQYMYKGRVVQPYLPKGIKQADSTIIEFLFFRGDTATDTSKQRIHTGSLELLYVDYFSSESEDIDKLFTTAYNDFKAPFAKEYDVSDEFDNKVMASGKEIVYKKSKGLSPSIEILKRAHQNGSQSIRLVLKMGER